MRMYPRSEFPVEKQPAIVKANGIVSRSAIRFWFSGVGCPHGNVEVTVAAIKSGMDVGHALRLGILAHAVADLSEHCTERYTTAILDMVRRDNAQKYPNGKCAKDLAARREERPSQRSSDNQGAKS